MSLLFRATVRLLLHSNSAINAWIYAYRLKEFRSIMKQDCLALPCCRHRSMRTCSTACSCPSLSCAALNIFSCCRSNDESHDVNTATTKHTRSNGFNSCFDNEVDLKDETPVVTVTSATDQRQNDANVFTISHGKKANMLPHDTITHRRQRSCSCDSGHVSDSELASTTTTSAQKSLTL